MKRILVPCDFSKPAINAFRVALELGARSKGSIVLLHVIEMPILNDTVLMPVLSFEKELFKELREKTNEKFERLLSKFKKTGVAVSTEVQFGTPAMMIPRVTKKNKIDLIIMGTHGSSGMQEIFIGSNAEKIIRESLAPVLVVKNYDKVKIKDIVFPVTSETINQAVLVEKIKELQGFFKATIHIVRVNTPATFATDTATRSELNQLVKKYRLKNYTINIFNELNPEKGILQFAKLVKGDLIAMGTQGRKGLAHFFNGSNTEDVVNHGDRLIWTYNLKNA
jgi:nucleotide-binding universal stress UspA family protein